MDEPDSDYYSVWKLTKLSDLRELFPDGEADTLNWVFFSTSGVHGAYTTLDDLESDWDDYDCDHWITVLAVRPRMVSVAYGNIPVTKEDIPYLRGLAKSTLQAVAKSQAGNL